MPRDGGDLLDRHDQFGTTYYEVRAENRLGNQGGAAPMAGGGGRWPRKVVVKTGLGRDGAGPPWSFWFIRSDNKPVYGDGTGYPDSGPAAGPGFVTHNASKWAIAAQWIAIDNINGGVRALTDWFNVGLTNTFDVPIPTLIIPQVIGGSYNPIVKLMYICNDDLRDDNGGWLHVYEDWQF